MKRPWNGAIEDPFDFASIPRHDPQNGLCPGTKRANGKENPVYEETYVFQNDFPSLASGAPQPTVEQAERNPLMRLEGVAGNW